MKRITSLAIVVLLCAGCRSPSQAYDPFLGRQTIPPPGTAVPPGQPYYNSPTVSPGAPVAPPTGGTLPTPTNFAPTPAGGNGFSSFSPNVSPLSPSATPNPTPGPFGRPAFTPVSSPARPNYSPPGGPAYPQANSLNPAGVNTAQAGVPKPLDVDGIVGRNPPASLGQPTPAVTPAAQWQPSGASAKTNMATPAAYTSTPNQGPVRVVEPAFTNRSSGSVPELSDLPPVNTQGMQPLSNARPAVAGASIAAASAATASRSPAASAAGTNRNVGTSNYGYDPQYRWLKGKLEYSQSDRSWKLRYIPADEAGDQFGGSVKLANTPSLNGFQSGDLVVVQGAVSTTRSTADQSSFAPLYNVARIQKQ